MTPSVLSLLALALIGASAAEPVTGFNVVVDDQPSYYALSGRTSQELSKASKFSGVLDEADGLKGAAGTVTDLTARFARQIKDGSCALTAVKVTVTVSQRLPSWDPPPDAADEALDWWKRFSSAIREHEDGHRRIGSEAGQRLLDLLQYLPAAPTCEALDDKVNEAIADAQDEDARRNAEYDRMTQHGKTQYARWFPPAKAGRP